MKARITNKANVTAWMTDVKISFSGTISAAAIELFNCIESVDIQAKALKIMQDTHERKVRHVQT